MDVMHAFGVGMWIVAAASALVSAGLGMILAYHLRRFAMNPRVANIAIATYSIGVVVLVLSMIAMTPAY